LRYSDYSQLTADNVYNDGRLLKVKTQKTNKDVVIPLNPFVLTILEKYDGQIPKSISNQRTNDYLKDLGKLADLNDRVEIKQTKGGILITKFLAEWERITTHTGRRSFATNAYLNGVPTIDIMAITGHTTETSFMKYIKVTAEETAIRLLNHPHFNQMSVFKIA
jgi:integrase